MKGHFPSFRGTHNPRPTSKGRDCRYHLFLRYFIFCPNAAIPVLTEYKGHLISRLLRQNLYQYTKYVRVGTQARWR